MLLTMPVQGYCQQMYDRSGSLIGRYDSGKIYDRSGSYEGKVDTGRFYDRSGSYIGYERDGKFYDRSGSYIGYTKDAKFYDRSGSYIGYINDDKVYNRSGSLIGRVNRVPDLVTALVYFLRILPLTLTKYQLSAIASSPQSSARPPAGCFFVPIQNVHDWPLY